jgi:hypothetical protein
MYNQPGFSKQLKIETIPDNSPSNLSNSSTETLEQGGLFGILTIYAFIAFLVTFTLRRWQISAMKRTAQKTIPRIPVTPSQPSPCHKCRFFNQNFYLGCAVHPSKVLKPEAHDCPDYWSEKSNTFSHQ